MANLTEIRFSGTTPLATVYAAIIGAGGERFGRSHYFGCPVELTGQQVDSLRGSYPRHADFLHGDTWVWVEGTAVVVGGGVHVYDTKCGRNKTDPCFIDYESLSPAQKEARDGLAGRIEEQLKERGGLAELATQA